MAENVLTGGVMGFKYSKDRQLDLDPKRKKDINDAYEAYYARREKEKRRKHNAWIIGIAIFLIILIAVVYMLLK